ncbi:hypothetical protein K2173_024585 [Erythroxylum novogranatense]|uniref:Pentatricopeptide repeat-containing protein n=1 Tax=Erythroxylum novogranatense TaxID=1862640 RepID=A0AAV8SVH6_9ROSI|nr:hypothetical protein K2173_024585 [Erythroxylum novogranatense]
MPIRSLISKARLLSTLQITKCKTSPLPYSSLTQLQVNPPLSDLVNDISRILSDHRSPHHDLEHPLAAYSTKISTSLVEQVLKRCKNLGFPAHRFFLWAKRIPGFEHSRESYHIMVDLLGYSREFALLWDFLIEMRQWKDFDFSPEIFWLVFRAYSRANLPADAIRAFDRMVEFGLKPSIHDVDQLLYVLCKRKHVKHAQQLFDKVKHEFEVSVKTYSILVRGWGDLREWEKAHKVFDEMTERKLDLDLPAHNSLLEALCRGGKVDEAYAAFQEMRSSGVEPDECSYSIFIRAYCEANDIHSAFRVLDRMRRYDLVPNVFTYNCLIKKLCKKEMVEEAYQLLNEMIYRGAKPDSWSYNTILAYHCDHSEVNRATKLISRMVKDGCSLTKHSYNMVLKLFIRYGERVLPSVSTYSVMVHGFCKKKDKLEDARKYFEMMIDEGIPPYSSTVEMLRNKLVALGLLDNIEILAGKMERSTCCSMQELAYAMRGNKSYVRSRAEESELESD